MKKELKLTKNRSTQVHDDILTVSKIEIGNPFKKGKRKILPSLLVLIMLFILPMGVFESANAATINSNYAVLIGSTINVNVTGAGTTDLATIAYTNCYDNEAVYFWGWFVTFGAYHDLTRTISIGSGTATLTLVIQTGQSVTYSGNSYNTIVKLQMTVTSAEFNKMTMGLKTISVPLYVYRQVIPLDYGVYQNWVVEDISCSSMKTTLTKEATLVWSGTSARDYDGSTSNISCTIGNLSTGDTCTVTVSGGDAKNVGTYTATAIALSNSYYTLPSSNLSFIYTINPFQVHFRVGVN